MAKRAILCVDDEAIILIALKQELKIHFGDRFTYETAINALDALKAIEELSAEGIEIAVVISDWRMPGMKGDEFLIRVHQRDPKIATFMITGQADDAAVARATELGKIRACIRKPWSGRELVSIIERAVS